MNELTLTGRKVLGLRGHLTVMEESRSRQCNENIHQSEYAVA